MTTLLFLRRTREIICLMSRKGSQTRVRQQSAKSSLTDVSNRLAKVQIGSKSSLARRYSTKNFSIDHLVESIKTGKYKRVVVLAGAGISTPSGIPDFRTPGTGLYDNLQRYNIPYPEAIFELSYFHRNPKPFFHLAKELYPGRYLPNLIHYFIRYLHDQNVLHRIYTQNIDGLERMVGIPAEKIVEAHGTFMTATCLRCRQKYDCDEIRDQIFDDQIPKCTKTPRCAGVIKPDIVFFGEDLPRRFQLYLQDLPMCDCCIVMGTSLAVYPFADIVDSTARSTPRLLINRQLVGTFLSPRPYDLTMIGDLELNVREVLMKFDAMNEVMTLMKKENEEHDRTRKFRSKSTNSTSNTATTTPANDRLKAAETFLEQRRKFSTSGHRRAEQLSHQLTPQPRALFNESTKTIIEQHNDALLLRRRRSKSALPVLPRKPRLPAPSSTSSSNSLNSSLSDSELTPFAFKRTSENRARFFKAAVPAAPGKMRANPLLNATLRPI